jgi:ribonuclease R
MKELLIKLINEDTYKSMNTNEIAEALGFSTAADFVQVVKVLNELEAEFVIARNSNNQYNLIERLGYFIGIIDIKQKGFGFVRIEDEAQDVFIPKTKINGALSKDKVLIRVLEGKSDRGLSEGVVVKIIERGLEFIIGNYTSRKDKGIVRSDNPALDLTVFVEKDNSLGAVTNHKVKVKLNQIFKDHTANGSVVEILGHKNDPGVDITAVAYQYNFDIVFPEPVMQEASRIGEEIDRVEVSKRKDLRNLDIVTIDGEDAKDLDDAITVQKLENGNYLLGVYIADVSHYVKEGSALDQNAYTRGTSVYLADRVIPMLPHILSNGICSLNEGVDRLVMSCDMEIDQQGNVIKHEIYEGVIRSKARMTYTAVNQMLEDQNKETIKQYLPLYPMFCEMKKLADILRQKRSRRGSIDFETSESKIIVDELGNVKDILLRERKSSEKLIEEFMLLANETVAEHFKWLDLPFIYRVHDEPRQEKLQKVIKIASILGHPIKGKENKVHPKALQGLLADLKDDPAERAINMLLLRSMAKAKYSETNIGHYGLASEYYTHFTSPIRRYPDLLVHRLLKEFVIQSNIDPKVVQLFQEKVISSSIQSSQKERDAIDCENEVNDMKKAEYMEQFIGEMFEGVISSLTNWGIYVELPNTIEGLIHVLEMTDDFYEYDETMMIMIGRRTKKIYKIGDIVQVELLSASKAAREINFKLVGMKKSHKLTPAKPLVKYDLKKSGKKGKPQTKKRR